MGILLYKNQNQTYHYVIKLYIKLYTQINYMFQIVLNNSVALHKDWLYDFFKDVLGGGLFTAPGIQAF